MSTETEQTQPTEPKQLTPEGHKARHKELHRALDELVADFIRHTQGLPSKTTLLTFMQWSSEQCENPTEQK